MKRIMAAACAPVVALMIGGAAMAEKNHGAGHPLFVLVDRLIATLPFTTENVGDVMEVTFAQTDQNDAFTFYEGSSAWQAEGTVLGKVDLRLPRKPGTGEPKGFLVFDVAGECMTPDEVRTAYPEHVIEPEPHLKRTEYIVTQHGGVELSFGIARTNGCVVSVVISPGRAKPDAGKG